MPRALRRFARALCGSQPSGDAYVVAMLEALIADPAGFPRDIALPITTWLRLPPDGPAFGAVPVSFKTR